MFFSCHFCNRMTKLHSTCVKYLYYDKLVTCESGTNSTNWCQRICCLTLPNDKLLDWSKFKAHENNKINVTQNMNFVLARVGNMIGKGENAGYQHFLLL